MERRDLAQWIDWEIGGRAASSEVWDEAWRCLGKKGCEGNEQEG